MKIYNDGEYANGKKCFNCGTEKLVFYDKKSDFFTCEKCLRELQKKNRSVENHVRKSNRKSIKGMY